MVHRRGATAGLCGWLLAAAALVALVVSDYNGQKQAAIEDVDALVMDDVCDGGDVEACAFSALQRRGQSLEGEAEAEDEAEEDVAEGGSADVSGEGNRRRKYQALDISKAWTKKLVSWILYLHKNLTHLEWKMYYLKVDMNSSNNTLFHIKVPKSKRYVNGTKVDWNQHPTTWLPHYSLAQEPAKLQLVSLLEEAAVAGRDGEAESETEEDVATGGRRRRSMKGVPPRKRKIQAYLLEQDQRLKDLWFDITVTKRKLGWMGNYMGSNRRFYHGRPVFVQKAESQILEAMGASRQSSVGPKDDWSVEPEPQTELVKQIKASINQTGDLWAQMRLLGGMVQANKRRVKRWRRGQPAHFLQQDAQESPEAWHEPAVGSRPEEGGRAAASLLASADEADWGFFGSFEQCCRCKSGAVGWSASGKCRFCQGDIEAAQGVVTECQIQSSSFKGSQACLDACKKAIGNATIDSVMQ